ncbi:MAG: anaerobic ribonucleoside-triphosphate reductase activating protein [Oscillospiraceae bacterium]
MKTLRLAGVVRESIVDGPGIRFTIFVQGCPHHCPGCHNAQTHDFSGGYDSDTDRLLAAIAKDPLLQGVTFSGGEPFEQAEALAFLGREIKARGLNLISYSGYTFEQLLAGASQRPDWLELLKQCDYLIDGRYEQEKRDLTLHFRGSSNQRILDVPQSLTEGRAVTVEL